MNEYFNTFNEVVALLNKAAEKESNCIRQVKANYNVGFLYSHHQFIKLDALDPSDYPNGIAENSIFVKFEIDFAAQKFEAVGCGHIRISDADREAYSRYKYLACHTMRNVVKCNGVSWPRKQKYKDAQDLAKRILKAYTTIMREVSDYTGGYPYSKGIKRLKNEK